MKGLISGVNGMWSLEVISSILSNLSNASSYVLIMKRYFTVVIAWLEHFKICANNNLGTTVFYVLNDMGFRYSKPI